MIGAGECAMNPFTREQPYMRRDASPLKPFVPFYPIHSAARNDTDLDTKAVLFIYFMAMPVVCFLAGAG